jgi:hypothetical protein
MATQSVAARHAGENGGPLGTLWILYGALRLAGAVALVMCSGVATVMFGALLSRVGDPFFWMHLFHLIYAVVIIVSILAGVFGLLAGSALLTRRPSARTLSIVASFFSVSEVPFGTTLGIYTLILFLR